MRVAVTYPVISFYKIKNLALIVAEHAGKAGMSNIRTATGYE
jgi:hypothetical protein